MPEKAPTPTAETDNYHAGIPEAGRFIEPAKPHRVTRAAEATAKVEALIPLPSKYAMMVPPIGLMNMAMA